MKKFYSTITAKPGLVVIIFLICSVICGIMIPLVGVNYDIADYLPLESPSTIAIDVMNREYTGGIPNARVMVKDLTLPQALTYKEQIAAVEGVTDITWLDDSCDILQPLETLDSSLVNDYFKDGAALYSVTIEEKKIPEAVAAIRAIIGDDNAITGTAASTAAATKNTIEEVSVIAVCTVLFVVFILIMTTGSWAEPLVIMIGLGIAIVINMGTNLFFGTISFVSNAAAPTLQIAVSLDYSVFLIHRFEQCRKNHSDVHEAMTEALCKSTASILSSGLTTVIGFVALCLMRFRIGPDMGLVLAKGVAISLISVFVLMPNLILLTYKFMDKTSHRPFVPKFDAFARLVTKVMLPLSAVFAVIMIPSYLASNANSYYYGASNIFGEGTEYGRDTEAVEAIYGKSDTYVLMVPKGDNVTMKKLSDRIQALPQVSSVLSYVDTVGIEIPEQYLDEETLSKLVSEHYSRLVLNLDTEYEGEDTFELVGEIRRTAAEFYEEYHLAGQGVTTYDLMETVTGDMLKVNLIAIGAVFIVLLLTMKSLSLPFILVLSIETAIWVNMSFPYFMDTTIFYISYLIVSSIQLGATVDYAILFTDRYLELRKECGKKTAIRQMLSSCVVSLIASSSVMIVVGFLMGYISTHGLLAQLGLFIGRGTLCSLMIVLFVLPGLLYLFDGIIGKTTLHSGFVKEK